MADRLAVGSFILIIAVDVHRRLQQLLIVPHSGRRLFLLDQRDKIIAGNPDVIREVCKECDIDVANYNCPGQIVISGEKEGVLKACGMLKEKGVKRAIPLNVAGAFHSRLMAEAGRQLRGPLADTFVSELEHPVVQNLTGAVETDLRQIKENLVGQVAGSVKWEDCVRTLIGLGAEKFVEFGPGAVLTGFVKKIDPSKTLVNVSGMIQ